MKIREICEEFITAASSDLGYFEIYKNPSFKELRSAANERFKSLRFIIDFEKRDVYVFDVFLLHDSAVWELNKEGLNIVYEHPNENNEDYGFGIGKLKGSKIFIKADILNVSPKRIKEIKNKNHSWLSKYFDFEDDAKGNVRDKKIPKLFGRYFQ